MQIVIIDFEAEKDLAGNHFPTEIGLCRPGCRPISSLIRPLSDWRVDERSLFNEELWLNAQKVGRQVEVISARFPSLTAGCLLVSDAAFFDQHLMERIGLKGSLLEFFPLAERLAQEKGIPRPVLNRWINEIDSRRTASHRAGEDAWVRAELIQRLMQAK
jgi:hypothetical protein